MKVLIILCAGLMLATTAKGFSLLGPYKPWMTETLAYREAGDIGGPMTLAEGYRWNLPTISYGFDESFLNYFGEEGVHAVEQAFAILNELPPMSQIDVNAYPTDSTVVNFEAQALGYLDLKSYTLSLLLQQLGLAEPSRFTFTIRAREAESTMTNYVVIGLNYDPLTFASASNVNGAAYTYQIFERANPLRADAHESTVNPLERGWTAVADRNVFGGSFYTGLTRDDVSGLRFLLHTNTVRVERLPVSVSLATNSEPSAPVWWPGPTNTVTNIVNTAVRRGVDKLSFVRMPWDTNLQQFIAFTNVFVDTYYTNNQRYQQTLERVIARPDILFRARDLGGVSSYLAYAPGRYSYSFFPRLLAVRDTSRWINHDDINGSSTLGGPGVIPPGATIDFGTPGRYVGLGHPIVIGQSWQWASFDGSLNLPIVFLGPERATTATISARMRNVGAGALFEWTALGILNAVYRIESTTNFVSWSTVTTVTNVDGHFVFSEPVTTPRRFYRAVRK